MGLEWAQNIIDPKTTHGKLFFSIQGNIQGRIVPPSGQLKIKDNKCIPCEDESVNRLVTNRQLLMMGHLPKVISVTLLCHKVPTEGAISLIGAS